MWAPRPSRYSVGTEQRRGGRNAASRRAQPGSGRGPTYVGATAITLLGWHRAAEGRARSRFPPGRARLGLRPHVCGCHGHHATRLVPSNGGEGAMLLPAGPSPARVGAPRMWVPRPSRYSAGTEQRRGGRNAASRRAEPGSGRGPAYVGATAITATRLVPSSGGEGTTPLPAGPSPARAGAPRVWVPRPSRYSIGTEQRRGGRNAASRRAEPGSQWPHVCGRHGHYATRLAPSSGGEGATPLPAGPSPARAGAPRVGATAVTLLGWCQAAEGRAQCRSPPGRARLGQGSHVCGRHSRHATRLVPSSRGEGTTPLPAGRSPAQAGAPRV